MGQGCLFFHPLSRVLKAAEIWVFFFERKIQTISTPIVCFGSEEGTEEPLKTNILAPRLDLIFFNMKKKSWGIIIIILVLLLLLAVYFIFFYKFPAPPPAVVEPSAQTNESTIPSGQIKAGQTAEQPASPLKKAEVGEADLVRMASAFAERFGSFSNQSDFGNIRDLQIFETQAMKDWSQNYISQTKAGQSDTSIYYGIVTKSILSQARQFDASAGQAEVLVKTQRRESAGASGDSKVFYQDIIIKYRLEGGVWRVDSADWQSK